MKKVKYILAILFIILIMYCFVKYLRKGHISEYKIEKGNKVFEITEKETKNEKKEMDNYYIEINVQNKKFNYQLFHDFDSKHKVIRDIYYYADSNIACIYPVFIDNYKVDIKCLKDDIYYNYAAIIGENDKLDNYVKTIKKYDVNDYILGNDKFKTYENINLYTKNINPSHVISITNLKGIYLINNNMTNHQIFTGDNYNRKISIFYKNYYLTADYNETHQFRNFYIVNLSNNKQTTIKSQDYISFDSYIQGVVEDNIYLYDKRNEKQYKINLSSSKIEEIKNSNDKVSYYDHGKWDYISKIRANKEILFNYEVDKKMYKDYDYVYKYGNELSGYYYLYKKVEDKYLVYRANIQDTESIEYLFQTSDIDSIIYIKDYIYFKEDNTIYYYQQEKGVRKVLEYDEIKFNTNLKFHVAEI